MSIPDEPLPPTGVPVERGDQSPTALLKVLKGQNAGQLIPLDGDKFILGRSPDCHVVINYTDVSRAHAQLVRVQGSYYIEDLKTQNGTYVNFQRVTNRVELKDGDDIAIGDCVCRFSCPRRGEDDTSPSQIRRLHDEPQDFDAWKKFIRRYRPMLVGWLGRNGMNQHDSEDLVQEILLTVCGEMPSFEYDPAKGRFRGWLKRILQNRLREHRRKKKGSKPLPDDLQPSGDIRRARMWSLDDKDDRWPRLMAYVRSKSDSRDADIFLRLLEDKQTPAQVAAQLGVTVNAVRLAKSRIMKELKELRRVDLGGDDPGTK